MPYIKKEDRYALSQCPIPRTEGELNYLITQMCVRYLLDRPAMRYADYNAVIGALECAKMEIYRRMVAPYEEKKIKENGDVYPEAD